MYGFIATESVLKYLRKFQEQRRTKTQIPKWFRGEYSVDIST